MGLLDFFGKSFQKQVDEALAQVKSAHPGVKALRADVAGKVVTLRGQAPDKETRTRVMEAFNKLVDTENTINTITVPAPPPKPAEPAPTPVAAPAPAPAAERIHQVQPGDTLGALAQKYYGKASLYMKIFEANRDQLDNPDLIKVGQKLKIPE